MQTDWNDIFFFTVLVEQETLTAAAAALDVRHTTVARRVARLEQSLGLRLFDRLGKRYRLTADGMRVYQHARGVAHDIRQFDRIARESAQCSEVVVSAPPLIARELVMPHYAAFARSHRHIRLTLFCDVHFSDLHTGQADIALRMARPTADDLVARRLRDVPYHFYARSDYVARTPRADWGYLTLHLPGVYGEQIAALLPPERVIFAGNDCAVVKTAVMTGAGVGLLPDYLVQPQDGLVRATPDTGEIRFSVPLYLVLHESLRHLPNVRAVADFLVAALKV